ncbi:MAG: NAD(P)-dependent oxidoreductase [Campylobacterota bacterium]|nr:NAD(P)-dependent oxidoreductase [Campylobacterota bacterium]
MNSKILILGSSGLLGQTLVEFFKQKNYSIGILSRKPMKYIEKNITAYAVNILDEKLLEPVIKEYDVIINCTGQITDPINQCLLLNTKGTTNIINAVKKSNKKLIHISSVSVYGTAEYVEEDSDLNPETPYGSMKSFSDYLIETNLTNYTILRVSNLFGKNQEKGIINYLTKSYLLDEKNLYFNNDGSLKRYYINIEDFALIVNEVMEQKIVGIYNIVGKDQLTIKELVAKFENILNYKYSVNYANTSSIENIETIDTNKIDTLIHQNFKTSIESFIKDL